MEAVVDECPQVARAAHVAFQVELRHDLPASQRHEERIAFGSEPPPFLFGNGRREPALRDASRVDQASEHRLSRQAPLPAKGFNSRAQLGVVLRVVIADGPGICLALEALAALFVRQKLPHEKGFFSSAAGAFRNAPFPLFVFRNGTDAGDLDGHRRILCGKTRHDGKDISFVGRVSAFIDHHLEQFALQSEFAHHAPGGLGHPFSVIADTLPHLVLEIVLAAEQV